VPGTHLLVDFLKAAKAGDAPRDIGKRVVVAGGGAMALEAARHCEALGAESIRVIFREAEADADLPGDAPDGKKIDIRYRTGVGRLFGEARELKEVQLVNLVSGDREAVPADTLILAAGRYPEFMFFRSETLTPAEEPAPESPAEPAPQEEREDLDATIVVSKVSWVAVAPYKKPADSRQQGLFSPGDPQTDYSAAIRAIGAGRRGAASIHQLLYGIPLSYPERLLTGNSIIQDVDRVAAVSPAPRQIMPNCEPGGPGGCRELEAGFTEEQARAEADRCLQCGLICYAHTARPAPETAVEVN
jgi:NADPH-dependent glutamate synthase beta subunit-like oxidoreductase